MNRRILTAAFAATALAATLAAQSPRKSPHDTASVTLKGQEITVAYGRPYLKGRKAVGGNLVPYGQVWRLGADEATKLTTPVDLMIGDLKVPAGSYALFTKATETGWTLIVNKVSDQWGAFSYDKNKAEDLGSVSLEMSKPPSTVEQFTMAFKKSGENAAMLTMTWENTTASVKVTAS